MSLPASAARRRVRARRRKTLALVVVLGTASSLLAACGGDSGKTTLTWYTNPDPASDVLAGQARLAAQCSTDAYDIDVQLLPAQATDQRVQLERRLAAEDSSIDLMSLDPVFTAEFADADFLEPIPDDLQSQLSDGVLNGALDGAMWDDKLVVAPLWANTQLLWYRKSVADAAGLDMSKPVTWDQIIDAAAQEGKTVQVQGDKYEAYVVLINALIQGAGGAIVSDTDKGNDATVDIDSEAAVKAAAIIQKLADSSAAPSDLSVSNEGTAQTGFFTEETGGFLTNWTFIWSGAKEDPTLSKDVRWARYPQTVAGQESKPPTGGINIGVSAFSEHSEMALEAAQCVTTADHQVQYALETGNMPANEAAYSDGELKKAYPMLDLFKESIDTGGPRPATPYWSTIVSAVLAKWHPETGIDPATTPGETATYMDEVLHDKALL